MSLFQAYIYLNRHPCVLSIRAAVVRHGKCASYLDNELPVSGAHRRLVSTFRRVDVAERQTARRTIYGQRGRRDWMYPPLLVGLQ